MLRVGLFILAMGRRQEDPRVGRRRPGLEERRFDLDRSDQQGRPGTVGVLDQVVVPEPEQHDPGEDLQVSRFGLGDRQILQTPAEDVLLRFAERRTHLLRSIERGVVHAIVGPRPDQGADHGGLVPQGSREVFGLCGQPADGRMIVR